MTAARLREAARVLRERAEAARPERGSWHMSQFLPEHRTYEHQAQVLTDQRLESYGFVASDVFIDDAAYIATMHPGVGLALADWLDTAGADLWAHGPLHAYDDGRMGCDDELWQPHARRALALADLILGSAS